MQPRTGADTLVIPMERSYPVRPVRPAYAGRAVDAGAASPPVHVRPVRVLRDDDDLVARCIAGEPAAQRVLFDREYPRVHATLYRILGSNHAIDDVLQETFLAVFRAISQFRGDASLSTWIDRCAVHAAFAHLRSGRGRRHLELLPETMASGDPSAERRVFAREAARRLYATLENLDDKQRVAFALHAIDGRPLQEVAKLMGASLVATKARVWRARLYVEKRARVDPFLAELVSPERSGKESATARESLNEDVLDEADHGEEAR
jgi:RNA polymerase sigma-70 factor (ECF subfamily)